MKYFIFIGISLQIVTGIYFALAIRGLFQPMLAAFNVN